MAGTQSFLRSTTTAARTLNNTATTSLATSAGQTVMNGKPLLLKPPTRNRMTSPTSIRLQGKTNGGNSSEHTVTWMTMVASMVAIVAQVAAELFLKIDLGIDINLALATGFGSGAGYTIARMVVKTGIAFAEGKVKAAAQQAAEEVKPVATPPEAKPVAATVIPPARTMAPEQDTKVW
jgi:hypothetical protein